MPGHRRHGRTHTPEVTRAGSFRGATRNPWILRRRGRPPDPAAAGQAPGSCGGGANPAAGRDRRPRLLQVVLELAAPGRVAELPESLRLDLADALAGDVELLAHFLEGPGAAVLQPEAELEHPSLATRQGVEHRLHLLLEQLVRGRLRGGKRA